MKSTITWHDVRNTDPVVFEMAAQVARGSTLQYAYSPSIDNFSNAFEFGNFCGDDKAFYRIQPCDPYAGLKAAHDAGKVIQQYSGKTGIWWDLTSSIIWCDMPKNYRIKPESKYRPWGPQEVPVGALIRMKNSYGRVLITGVTFVGGGGEFTIQDSARYGPNSYSADDALLSCEHSTDHGETWWPCGVME